MPLPKLAYKSTQQLIDSLKERELQAYELLYDQFSSTLYNYIILHIPIKEEAEKILENSFLKVWITIDSYSNDGRFYTWIVQLTKNEVAEALKEKAERQQKIDRVLKELFLCNSPQYRLPSEVHPAL